MTILRLSPDCWFLLCASMFLGSCRSVIHPGVPGAEFAAIKVTNGQVDGPVVTRQVSVYRNPAAKPPKVPRPKVLDKTHPIIDRWIKDKNIPDTRREEVMVGFWEPAKVVGEQIHRAPLDQYEALLKERGAENIQRFDSIAAFLVSLPIKALRGPLSSDPNIRYIEPNRVPLTLDMIPGYTISSSTCKGGAGYPALGIFVARISTLASAAGLSTYPTPSTAKIALLDTGVNNHALLPAASIVRKDCLNSTSSACPLTSGFDGLDGCLNHGTPDAGILIANGTMGQPAGVLLGAELHSFKVIQQTSGFSSCTPNSIAGAVVRALENEVVSNTLPVDVILTEVLLQAEPYSSTSVAADKAFEAGYPVISAANSSMNMGYGPANAHKAFPVSANNLSVGRTKDKRIVPAIWAKTSSETTSGVSPANPYCVHDGSSGAAPYAAAAALKLKYLLNSVLETPIGPGNIYALLLALSKWEFGKRMLNLPPSGQFLLGSFPIYQGDETMVPVSLAAGEKLRAAIWWPESPSSPDVHNKIVLEVVKPNLYSAGKADDNYSVFQYKSIDFPIITGQWTLKITGANVISGPQTVYWAAYVGQ